MNFEDLKRVQEIDYELLCAVDDICKRHNIQYCLMFGALLGAVRHKEQIPWDDDIDIAMTRENYLRFYEVANKELDGDKYFVKVMGSGSLDYISELKLGVKNTLYCMPGCEECETMNSVTLDIFCFDYAKMYSARKFRYLNRIAQTLWLIKQNAGEKKLLTICIDKSNVRMKCIYKLGVNVMLVIRSIFGEKFFEKIVYKMFVDETCTSDCYWERTSPHYFPREWMDETVELDFGSRKFPCPIGYDALLTAHYGDYMQLPPVEKRVRKYFDIWIFREKL